MNQLGTIALNRLFASQAVTATHDSIILDFNLLKVTGNISVHYTITGTGTLDLVFLQSNVRNAAVIGDFTEPTGNSIGTGLVVGSDLLDVPAKVSGFIIIRAVNATLSPVLTLDIALQ